MSKPRDDVPIGATFAENSPAPSLDELLATMREVAAKHPPPVVLTYAPPPLREMALRLIEEPIQDACLRMTFFRQLAVDPPRGFAISFLSLLDPEPRAPEFEPDLDFPRDCPPCR